MEDKKILPAKTSGILFFMLLCFTAFISCKNLQSVDAPSSTQVNASRTLVAPINFKATNGGKRKVKLSWSPVESAKVYYIYYGLSPNDTFKKIGEKRVTLNDDNSGDTTTSYEDSVSAGRTYYYKISAVNGLGKESDFSSIQCGSSLATPIISSIEVNDTEATVLWYMENSSQYIDDLAFDVYCMQENNVVDVYRAQGMEGEHTFTGLSSKTNYNYYVEAYLKSEQNDTEKSPEVTKETYSQYTPVPPEFTASQGESADSVKLLLTLPPKVQVPKDKCGAEKDVDYPLYFTVERKFNSDSDDKYTTVVKQLFCNGKTSVPTKDEYSTYYAGSIIEWRDTKETNAARGLKYKYRIKSYIDNSYNDEKLNAEGKQYTFDDNTGSRAFYPKEDGVEGWVAALATFDIDSNKYSKVLDDKGTEDKKDDIYTSVTLGWKVFWNDMDRGKYYKFALRQNRKKLSRFNGGTEDTSEGVNSWITDADGKTTFASLDSINAADFTKTYTLPGTTEEEGACGIYTYTLYIIPESFYTADKGSEEGNYLEKIKSGSVIVDSKADVADTTFTRVEGGWTDRIKLVWRPEPNVASYSLKRVKKVPDDADIEETIPAETLKNALTEENGLYSYTDKGLDGGFEYVYTLVADDHSDPMKAKHAVTLGTPCPTFTTFDYDTVTVSWKPVISDYSENQTDGLVYAERYKVQLGSVGDSFGAAQYAEIRADGSVINTTFESEPKAVYNKDTREFTLTMEKPYGFNIATLSGAKSPCTITAFGVYNEDNTVRATTNGSTEVYTLGPATLNAMSTREGTNLAPESITVTWKELDGKWKDDSGAGYAVVRTRPAFTGQETEATDIYYITTKESPTTALTGGTLDKNAVTVSKKDGLYTLTDTFKYCSNDYQWDKNQGYIAYGVPFTYTVIPVLNQDDAKKLSEEKSLLAQLKEKDFGALNKVQAQGFTTGYGLGLTATKAEYTDKVVLDWDIPPSAAYGKTFASLFYREKGTADWKETNSGYIKKNDSSGKKENWEFIPDQSLSSEALEYAVTYNSNMSTAENSTGKAYTDYLASRIDPLTKDFADNKECYNVGYMFTLPEIKPTKQTSSSENVTEEVTWKLYDKSKRALGPDSGYTLYIKNLNINGTMAKNDNWWTLFKYDAEGKVTYTGNEGWYNTDFVTTGEGDTKTVKLTPKDLNDNKTYDGLLKVQRDYKHYYKITATRKNTQGETITASSEDYAYRKITPAEFKRGIGIILADALFQAGIPKAYSPDFIGRPHVQQSTTCGAFTFTHTAWIDTFTWNTGGDYKHEFPRTPAQPYSKLISGWTIKLSAEGGTCKDNTLKSLPETDIDVTHETGLPSYTNSKFTVSGTNGKDDWFPYDFGKAHGSPDNSLNKEFQIYNGDWWPEPKDPE